MNLDFSDENIMLVRIVKILDRMKDLSQDPDGLWFLTKLLMCSAMELVM